MRARPGFVLTGRTLLVASAEADSGGRTSAASCISGSRGSTNHSASVVARASTRMPGDWRRRTPGDFRRSPGASRVRIVVGPGRSALGAGERDAREDDPDEPEKDGVLGETWGSRRDRSSVVPVPARFSSPITSALQIRRPDVKAGADGEQKKGGEEPAAERSGLR
jgi:hypothetical protein